MSDISCGIDFGTTNSAIATFMSGQTPVLIPLNKGNPTIPTAIFFPEENKTPLFGEAAAEAYILGQQGRFMRSLKRVLGTALMGTATRVNDKNMFFEEILSQFIIHLKQQAENHCGTKISKVVMGRPVHFIDYDPKGDERAEAELRRIASLAGFKDIEFQFEPIAAAYAHETALEKERLACVADIGGGTSDFTVIKIGGALKNKRNRSDDILASSGVRIGGNDFDKGLAVKAFMPELGMGSCYKVNSNGGQILNVPTSQYFDLAEWSKVNSVYSYKNLRLVREVLTQALEPEKYGRLLEIMERENGHRLLNAVEAVKIELTSAERLDKILDFVTGNPKISVNRLTFQQSLEENAQKLKNCAGECLKKAKVKAEDINLLILTGGSTEIPYLQRQLCDIFPQAEVSAENKLASVGLGLAYDCRCRFGL